MTSGSQTDLPTINEPDPNEPFTLGTFNNLKKLSASAIRVWSEILNQRPDTKLLIKSSKLASNELREQLVGHFAEHGVDESRLDLRDFSPTIDQHLETYNKLDLALDTFPYTGTTTTCESLMMGVPTLTLLGSSHSGRVSASILTTVGRADMIAESESDYIARAVAHIDRGKLSKDSRESLRAQSLSSQLCDQAPYTDKVQQAYRTLWTQWCGG